MRSHRGCNPRVLRMTVGVGFVVTSKHTNPAGWQVEVLLFEIAHCLWICSSFYSNFEKQNRKGSPQSLIHPYKGKLTSFVIKQFFLFKKEHQTLMRSRLSAVFAAQLRFDCKNFDVRGDDYNT